MISDTNEPGILDPNASFDYHARSDRSAEDSQKVDAKSRRGDYGTAEERQANEEPGSLDEYRTTRMVPGVVESREVYPHVFQ
jgi:hypothetical protein